MATVCASPTCGKDTESALKCPVCLKNGVNSVFCDQSCFRSSWSVHKHIHPSEDGTDSYNPFPDFSFSGELRPAYPLSDRRPVAKHIKLPDYAKNGKPISEIKNDRVGRITQLSEKDIKKMRKVSKVSREILDVTASHVRPGITTDELDAILHKECMKRNAYPSPLNYYNFPKSVCTSINEVICHGIPDKTVLKDGDIINLDVTIYYMGLHSDLNETYYVGDKAKCDPDTVRLVETTRECLDLAIKAVKPGLAFRELGNIIQAHATKNDCSVVRTYCGHGIGELFHCQPNIPHYAKNKAIGIIKPGMVFTIEPMLCLGTHKDMSWPDNWTAVTEDGKKSAQFEHMLLATETGVEVLTARSETSPGGPVARIE
ncbi:methionine aminopeptidase 1 precursor [Suhomyces tanzawaensis NRRL Y-17324]|uniref:Methionine aminopeptidase n=1 Tax=Suhomyces tanzawaensis NRRL Y-17324 TaxID=984487 RepID=A0A1E4SLX7_9ASCO|nr:methionine aminopeptidase 1 precursor [Suhomyces tanzawaensis NRRL Y-17324]ODV80529.1 methionine aminopeptidase 1 precursor [Suhomyces tanzawaensis NRRL Y-17324]